MAATAVNQAYSITDQLKQLPIDNVYRRYIDGNLRQRGSRFYSRCPWHGGASGDKNPSLVLYSDSNSWFCFGCNAGGSTVDLVMQALDVDFKSAVKVMAADFGIAAPDMSPRERAEARRKSLLIKYKRELEDRFTAKVDEAHRDLVRLYRAIDGHLVKIRSIEDLEKTGELFHVEVVLENALETLRNGTVKEHYAVLNDPQIRGWLGWR